MSTFFRSVDGRVRSGWVVAAFAAVASAAGTVAAWALGPQALESVNSPEMVDAMLITAISAAAATAVGAALGEHAGAPWRGAGSGLAKGAVLGAVLIATAVVVPWLAGAIDLQPSGLSAPELVTGGVRTLLVLAPAAFAEELLVRGVPFRALARGLSPVAATVMTGAGFGLLHLGNPGASTVAAANVALVGVWLGLLVMRTGALWVSTGAHLMWNFGESYVFGQRLSGLLPGPSLVVSEPTSAGFFTDEAFGPEGSAWTAVVLAVAVVATWFAPKWLDSPPTSVK